MIQSKVSSKQLIKKMSRFAVIIFIVVCCTPQAFGLWQLIRAIIENYDTDVHRFRTPEELAQSTDKAAVLDFIGLVEQYAGYTAEEYQVETSDGYILTLHRVTGSPSRPAVAGKPVAYIGHGLFGGSDFFAVLGPQQSLLFVLADTGYDVWIGNFRGNTYSKRHVHYSSSGDNLEYWDFSMDELALIDLPLFIDTVLEKTSKTKLSYIGYSMGNTLCSILLAGKPEYNEKMHVVVSIAPVLLFTPPYSSLLTTLLPLARPAKTLALASRVYQILPQSKLVQIIGDDVCVTALGQLFCKGFLSNVVNVDRMNTTVIPTILSYVPAGASLFMIDHYAQLAKTGKFRAYSYGIFKNLKKYGSLTPPEYDLTKITSAQALFYSASDVFSNARDVETLNRMLPNVVAMEKIPDFNHLDYVWLDEAKEAVYNRLLQVIDENLNE